MPQGQLELIKKTLSSSELDKWREKVKSETKDMLDKLFTHHDIKHDVQELKDALLYKKSVKDIVENYAE